jgi:serine/threonine-protein phosphatase 2A activator
LSFINQLNTSARGTKLTDEFEVSETVQNIMDLLEKLSKLIDDTPPIPQPQRFGNKAFKTWLTQVKEVKILKPLFLHDSIILGF